MSEQPLSPDAPEPVIPSLLDYTSAQDLLDGAIEQMQRSLPEWTPRVGNVEYVLLEALVDRITVLVFSLEEVPTRLLEQLLRLYGITRDSGAPAQAVIEIETTGASSVYQVPAGTRLRLNLESTGESVDWLTAGRLEIVTGESRIGQVVVRADEPGTRFNQIPAESSLQLVDNLPFVERVRLVSESAGGRDQESDAAFQARAASLLGRLVSTLVQPSHFEQAALTRPEVGRARVVDTYDPTNPSSGPGDDPGHTTVVVADNDGQPLNPEQRRELAYWLSEQALASLIVHVEDPEYTEVDIAVEVRAHPDADPEDVEAAVTDRVTEWLSPARWDWGGTVEQFGLVGQILQAQGVSGVISAPADIPLDGVAPLPMLRDLTVTVRSRDDE